MTTACDGGVCQDLFERVGLLHAWRKILESSSRALGVLFADALEGPEGIEIPDEVLAPVAAADDGNIHLIPHLSTLSDCDLSLPHSTSKWLRLQVGEQVEAEAQIMRQTSNLERSAPRNFFRL